MVLDALLQLSDSQAVTVDAVSTNTIDFGNVTPKRDPFAGVPMEVVISIEVAAVGTGTYVFEAISSASADLSTPTILISRTILAADLTAGSVHHLPLPANPIIQRYFGLNYNTGGTSPGATISAFLQPQEHVDAYRVYDSGFDIT